MGSQNTSSVRSAVGSTALVIAAILSFLGPNWIRNDLRSDMNHLALLRSYPLPGRTIVIAEILGSTLALTAIQLLLVVVGYIGLTGTVAWNRYGSPHAVLLLAAPIGLIVNAIGMTVQNAAALLFPSWVRFDSGRPGGFETLGQNILSSLFTVFLSLVALAGPVVTGWLIWTRVEGALGAWAAAPTAAGVVVMGALELSLLMRWLGRVFDRTESIL
jgi:hypothetical protein